MISWQSEDQENGGYDIYVRTGSYDSTAGVVLTDQARANSAVIAGDQTAPAVAMDATGRYVVAWQGDNPDPLLGTDIYFKAGTFAGGIGSGDEALANIVTAGDQTSPAVAVDPATGDLLVAWKGLEPAAEPAETEPAAAILMNLFRNTPDQVSTGEIQVNAGDYSDLANPTAAFNATGQIAVAWQTEGGMGTGSDIAARRFLLERTPFTVTPIATDTAAADADLIVNQTTAEPQRQPAIGSDAAGNLLAVWQTQRQDGFSWAIFGRRLDAAAGPNGTLGDEFLINTGIQFGPQTAPAVSSDAAGRFLLAWQSLNQNGSSWAVVQRLFAADGTPAAGEAVVNTATRGPQILPVIAQRPAGDATILWSGGGEVSLPGEGERQDSLFASDDFARPDSSDLGSGWIEAYGGFALAAEAAVTTADKALATLVDDAPADVSVSGTIQVEDVIGAFAGFAARVRDGIDSPLGDTIY